MSFISVSPEHIIVHVLADGRSEGWKREGRKERRRKERRGKREGAGKMLNVGRQPFYSMMDSFREIA